MRLLLKLLREGLGRIIVFFDFITRPKRLKRSLADQDDVKLATESLSLYQFYACPFCVKTRRAMHRLNLPIATKDAQKEGPYRAELEQQGGKVQVPCLKIEEKSGEKWLYDSKAIIEYLETRFA